MKFEEKCTLEIQKNIKQKKLNILFMNKIHYAKGEKYTDYKYFDRFIDLIDIYLTTKMKHNLI